MMSRNCPSSIRGARTASWRCTGRGRSRETLGLAAADVGTALRNIGVERIANRGVHRGLLIFLERLLPKIGRPLRRVLGAAQLPVLLVLPVGHARPIECVLIPFHGVRLAEEMAAA